MMTHLVIQDKRVIGVLGYIAGRRKLSLLAKAVVLAAGGCGFKGYSSTIEI